MIIYSVNITVDRRVEDEWLEWMQQVHVPQVVRTGCFIDARISKILDGAGEEASYVIQYQCRSFADYDRYRENFAAALQKDHTDRFAGHFRASRQLLEELAKLESAQES
ncbi:MAG: DUF4286 family protein [Verrucomicrobiaceae bacterium]|nr:DUF4286 family protein [Verrucomicrobiaceae bacterium]